MSEIKKTGRIQEIDMAKGVLILLMVAFHLGLFNTKYPHACQIVYILLFSPLFTVVTKFYAPFFAFDDSAILWTVFSLSLVVSLCLFCAMLFDRLSLSRIVAGKNIYSKL